MIVRARYALLGPGVVRRDVRLEVDGERIAAIHSGYVPGAPQPDHDFGLAVITPGLVNSHAHLELEFCRDRVPYRGSFIQWLQDVRDLKQELPETATTFPRETLAALRAGGCTTVLDHHTINLQWESVAGMGLRYLPFREFFMFDNHQPDLERMREAARLSYAPHSSYTASIEVARACRTLADAAGLPISVHLSEFPAEIEFIRSGRNSDVERLLDLAGATDSAWRGTGMSPIALFASHGVLSGPTYLVHGNYLEPGDLELLGELKPTIVYCPHSHAFFQHPAHPLPRYLAAGIDVALGTDSLASNDALSPLREAALARQRLPQVAAADLFAAITVRGLKPLGWDRRLGRLEPGYLADFAVFPLPADPGADFGALFDALLATQRSALTVCGGKVIHGGARDALAAEPPWPRCICVPETASPGHREAIGRPAKSLPRFVNKVQTSMVSNIKKPRFGYRQVVLIPRKELDGCLASSVPPGWVLGEVGNATSDVSAAVRSGLCVLTWRRGGRRWRADSRLARALCYHYARNLACGASPATS